MSYADILIQHLQIMVDALSSAKQAQKSMIEAEQAAKEARISFLMTQTSIVEMAQMVQQPNSIIGKLVMGKYRFASRH